jgi:hypothetical protein
MTTANPDVYKVFCDSRRFTSTLEKFSGTESLRKKSPATQPGSSESFRSSKTVSKQLSLSVGGNLTT